MHQFAFVVATLMLAGVAAPVNAQTPAAPIAYAVAYLDVMPAARTAAVAAFKSYREASEREAGHIRVDVYEQIGRPGHFAVVEAWADLGASDNHAAGSTTKQLHQALEKIRVSGYDQRPYRGLTVTAPGSSSSGAVHVVSHVDFAGQGALAAAPGLLQTLAETSRKEQGNLRFDVLQHAMRMNHFTVVESWASQAALDSHAAAMHTRHYRDTLQTITGSPLDERVYAAVE